jgi:hypothetical protein
MVSGSRLWLGPVRGQLLSMMSGTLWIPIVALPCEGSAALDVGKWRMQLLDSELWRAELGSSFRSGTSLRDYTRVRGVFSHEVTLWWSARPPVRESWSFGPARSP